MYTSALQTNLRTGHASFSAERPHTTVVIDEVTCVVLAAPEADSLQERI